MNSTNELELVREIERLKKAEAEHSRMQSEKMKILESENERISQKCGELENLLEKSSRDPSFSHKETLELKLKIEEMKIFLPSEDFLANKVNFSELYPYDILYEKFIESMNECARIKEDAVEALTQERLNSLEEIQTLSEKLLISQESLNSAEEKMESLIISLQEAMAENKKLVIEQDEIVNSIVERNCMEIQYEFQRRENILKQHLINSEEKCSELEYKITQFQQKIIWLQESLNNEKVKERNEKIPSNSPKAKPEPKETFPIEKVVALEEELSKEKSEKASLADRNKELSIRLSSLDYTHSKLESKHSKLLSRLEEVEKVREKEREDLKVKHKSQIIELEEQLRLSNHARVTQFVQNNFTLKEASDEDSSDSEDERRKTKGSLSHSLADEVKALRNSLRRVSQSEEFQNVDVRSSISNLKKLERKLSNTAILQAKEGSYESMKEAFEKMKMEKKEILSDLIKEQKENVALKEEVTLLKAKLMSKPKEKPKEVNKGENHPIIDYRKESVIKEAELSKSLSAFNDLQAMYIHLRKSNAELVRKNNESLEKMKSLLADTFESKERDFLKNEIQRLKESLEKESQEKKQLESDFSTKVFLLNEKLTYYMNRYDDSE